MLFYLGLALLTGLAAFLVANYQTVIITTIYLHRSMTHESVIYAKWFQWFCKINIWLHTSIRVKEWVGIHRRHHACADKECDPHSPWFYGFWEVQFWNVARYGEARLDVESIEEYTRDIPYTWWDFRFFNHAKLGLGLGGFLYLVGFGTTGFLWGGWVYALVMGVAGLAGFIMSGLIYVFIESASVNGLGHWPSRIGYRNYIRGAAQSYNLRLPGPLDYILAWFLGGEGLHNNHHGSPKSANFAHEKGEHDPGGVHVKGLALIGIAKKVKNPHLDPNFRMG